MYIYDNILLNSPYTCLRQICSESQNSRVCLTPFPPSKIVPLWDNVGIYGGARQAIGGNIIWLMRFECWVTKATNTHSEYAILIVFPLQQWLRKRPSILRLCTYILCRVAWNSNLTWWQSFSDPEISLLSWLALTSNLLLYLMRLSLSLSLSASISCLKGVKVISAYYGIVHPPGAEGGDDRQMWVG